MVGSFLRGALHRQIFPGLLVLLILRASAAHAMLDFGKSISLNAWQAGRGGTAIALADNPTNMNLNPAILGRLDGSVLQADVGAAIPDLTYEYTGAGGERFSSKSKDRLIPIFGLSYATNSGPLSWGVGVAPMDGFAADYSVQSKYFGPTNGFSEVQHMRTSLNVAYEVLPTLAVGARVGLDYGSADFRLPLGRVFLDVGQSDAFGYSGGLGLLFTPISDLSFGAYYETPTRLADLKTRGADGVIRVAHPIAGTLNFGSVDTTVSDFQFPENYGVGVAYQLGSALRVSSDVKFIRWRKYWNEIELKFEGQGGDDMRENGFPTTLKIPFKVDNQVAFSCGVEWFLSPRYTLAAGYHHANNPVPQDFLNPLAPGYLKHEFAVGFTFAPTDKVKLGLSYEYGILEDPKTGTSGVDSAISSQLGGLPVDSELNDAEMRLTLHALRASLAVEW